MASLPVELEAHIKGEVEKAFPMSKGTNNKRKRKPHIIAVINDTCTGCAGSPACVEYCPVAECMYWVRDTNILPSGASWWTPCSASAANCAPARVPMAHSSKAVPGTPLISSHWRNLRPWGALPY